MPTPYEKLYENLLPKFRSYEIPLMTTDEVKEELHDYLLPAIVRFHVCENNLKDRDDILEQFNMELLEEEIEILSNFMLLEYIDANCIRTPSDMLTKLLEMREVYRKENETLLSRYAWIPQKDQNDAISKLKKCARKKHNKI